MRTKEQSAAWMREWRKANPERAREHVRKYARTHPEIVKAANKKWRDRNPERSRASSDAWGKRYPEKQRAFMLRWKYGLEIEEYDAMVARHAGKCGSCQREARLFVDHCHATNKIRGMLCHHCNTALGLLKDDPQRIAALGSYLERAR